MDFKHTPGPWYLDKKDPTEMEVYVPSETGGRYIIAERIGGQVYQDDSGKYTDYSEVMANASLLKAAPALLEALCSVLDSLGALTNKHELLSRMSEAEAEQVWSAYSTATGEH